MIRPYTLLLPLLVTFLLVSSGCKVVKEEKATWQWETVKAKGIPTARHEAGLVAYDDKLYLMGGRRINPTSVYDVNTNSWTEKSATPIEVHHFQAVNIDDKIYLVGAMTGGWPSETPLDKVLVYYPDQDRYEYTHSIPAHRRRGGAGVAVYDGKIYLVGGITNGHNNGYKAWFDEYDPQTGEWRTLPDAPAARDHFQAVVVGSKLYAFAGRNSSHITQDDMNLTIEHGNVYDFETGVWEQVTTDLTLPTQRAGNSVFTWQDEVIVGGGESTAHVVAHSEMEAFNTQTNTWRSWPSLIEGRHGTGLVTVGDYVYTASGCGNRGGEPELTTLERLKLPLSTNSKIRSASTNPKPVFGQWHTVTLSFEGPTLSEDDTDNPFLNYALVVDFKHEQSNYRVRGFYAADGNAAESSATKGNVWQVRFTPDQIGEWTYTARMYKGNDIAIATDEEQGTAVELLDAQGSFIVTRSDKDGSDFRSKGRLIAHNGFFKFKDTDNYWMKSGTNSPENFLAFEGFDDTYRIKAKAKDGEAEPPSQIHKYAAHVKDWKTGDLTWKGDKGKGIVGALNYLASKEMNAVYFLTLNILGDGKDVWPYMNPDDYTRFDVSRMEQWNVLFEYMQSKGILLHLVTQETENETMLDNGDTGRLRKLYFNELIARYGHHLGLVWNLGEENGPAPWAPSGQNDDQRKAMATYLKQNDPYNHPVLLHTHSYDPLREEVLTPMLGYKDLDGLSLQANIREGASGVVERWKKASREAGNEWLITMDEIGEWHTAVLTDELDPGHKTIRQYAMWGTLMSGAAGVEWYFGAKYPHNDLSCEDWRQRDELWDLTAHARQFFDVFIPYWEMTSNHDLVSHEEGYCLYKANEVYAVYLPDIKEDYTLDLKGSEGSYSIGWFDPLSGGRLKPGTVESVEGGGVVNLGVPESAEQHDWVVLLEKRSKED